MDTESLQQDLANYIKNNPNLTAEQIQQLEQNYKKQQQDYQNQQEKIEKQKQMERQQILSTKYQQLLKVIDELGRDIRPAYAGSRGAPERLKKGIHSARQIVRDCLSETEKISRNDV